MAEASSHALRQAASRVTVGQRRGSRLVLGRMSPRAQGQGGPAKKAVQTSWGAAGVLRCDAEWVHPARRLSGESAVDGRRRGVRVRARVARRHRGGLRRGRPITPIHAPNIGSPARAPPSTAAPSQRCHCPRQSVRDLITEASSAHRRRASPSKTTERCLIAVATLRRPADPGLLAWPHRPERGSGASDRHPPAFPTPPPRLSQRPPPLDAAYVLRPAQHRLAANTPRRPAAPFCLHVARQPLPRCVSSPRHATANRARPGPPRLTLPGTPTQKETLRAPSGLGASFS